LDVVLFEEKNVTSSVTHFEIYAEHPPKLAEFYQSLLGWRIEQAPGIDYWRIQSGANTANGLNGGLTYRPFPGPRSWVHYVHVDSLDRMVAEVIRLGGEVLRPKTAVPKTAWYAVVADPEGNIFAIWQPDEAAFPPPEPD
jgi:predicted enzyme related to lactoylglutathione lyase